MKAREKERRKAQALAEAWNAAHPVGTPVTVPYLGELRETRTRSEAMVDVELGVAYVFLEGLGGRPLDVVTLKDTT